MNKNEKLERIKVRQSEIETDPTLNLVVPQRLTHPHRLILEAQSTLTSTSSYSRYKGMISTKREELSISSTPKNIGRLLRFFDAFIKLLSQRGHQVIIKYDETQAIVFGQEVQISLREKRKKVKKIDTKQSWPEYDYYPTEVMIFKIWGWNGREWQDGREPLELKLANILAYIEYGANKLNELQEQHENDRVQQLEIERIMLEQKQKEEKELADTENLFKDAKNWQDAKILRNYIRVKEKTFLSTDALIAEHKKWIEWANEKADQLDPLTNKLSNGIEPI